MDEIKKIYSWILQGRRNKLRSYLKQRERNSKELSEVYRAVSRIYTG